MCLWAGEGVRAPITLMFSAFCTKNRLKRLPYLESTVNHQAKTPYKVSVRMVEMQRRATLKKLTSDD